MDNLKPCPFCGESRISISIHANRATVKCLTCKAAITRDEKRIYDMEQAKRYYVPRLMDAWNRRAT